MEQPIQEEAQAAAPETLAVPASSSSDTQEPK
jgi:hypothetical protein